MSSPTCFIGDLVFVDLILWSCTKVGSVTSGWEHFFNWLRTEDEKEKSIEQRLNVKAQALNALFQGFVQKINCSIILKISFFFIKKP